jgi:hypothetical protein
VLSASRHSLRTSLASSTSMSLVPRIAVTDKSFTLSPLRRTSPLGTMPR